MGDEIPAGVVHGRTDFCCKRRRRTYEG